MRRSKVLSHLGPLFLSLFLWASIASTPALQAQAPVAGATVAVRMVDTIDSGKDPAGKQYRSSVTKAVDAGNGVTIPQGAVATVTLKTGNGSEWTTQLVSVTINGQPVAVTSGPASVTAGTQSAAGNAVSSINSVLGGFGHHVKTPAAATAIATGQQVLLPPGTTLTFVLSQPLASAVPAASAAQPMPAVPAQTASAGQHWWMCRYQDPRDPAKPALGSRMYFALFPTSTATAYVMNNQFNAYIKQNYKVADFSNSGNGFCKRYPDDAAARANSMNLMQKDWASINSESIQVPWSDTSGQNGAVNVAAAPAAPVAASPAISHGGPFISCSTSGGAGIDTYYTGVFQTTKPVKHQPNGGNLVDQSVLDDFYAYLKQKGYNFKPGTNYGCAVAPTEAAAIAAHHKRAYEGGGCSTCGKIVETGWKDE